MQAEAQLQLMRLSDLTKKLCSSRMYQVPVPRVRRTLVLITFYAFSAIGPNGTSREYRRTKFPYRYCHRRPNPADLPG